MHQWCSSTLPFRPSQAGKAVSPCASSKPAASPEWLADARGMGVCSQARERFYQFLWRPRAPSLLSREAEADLLKRLKEFSKRYDEEDNALLDEVLWPALVACRKAQGRLG